MDEPSKQRDAFRYDAKGRRDPFVFLVRDGRPVGIAQTPREYKLTPVLYGILWDPRGQSIALIDGAELKVGDPIGAYRVREIQEHAVVLTNGGEPVVLTIAFETPPSKLSPTTTMGGEGQ
jgi:hypothetical protein